MSLTGGVVTLAVLFLSGKILVADYYWKKYQNMKEQVEKKDCASKQKKASNGPVKVEIKEDVTTTEETKGPLDAQKEILMRKFQL